MSYVFETFPNVFETFPRVELILKTLKNMIKCSYS